MTNQTETSLYLVAICLSCSAALLCITLWRQKVLIRRYPDVQDQRGRFHAGALSLFFSPTAGHVWFSLCFPWFVLILIHDWMFPVNLVRSRPEIVIPWIAYPVLLIMILLPLLSLQQLERELEALRESRKLDQGLVAIKKKLRAVRILRHQGAPEAQAVIKL